MRSIAGSTTCGTVESIVSTEKTLNALPRALAESRPRDFPKFGPVGLTIVTEPRPRRVDEIDDLVGQIGRATVSRQLKRS